MGPGARFCHLSGLVTSNSSQNVKKISRRGAELAEKSLESIPG